MKEITWDMVAQTLAWIGTGGWLAYVIKGHGRRLGVFEKSIETLERALPVELEKRLRTIEQEKIGINDHARICSSALRSVEIMVASIKETVEQHASRLARGDDLLIELKAATAELKAAVRETKNITYLRQ
jgi:chromosome segregation ATPase